MDKLNTTAVTGALVAAGMAQAESLQAQGVYVARLYDKDGNLKWEDTFDNVVTTLGGNDMLDKYLAGSAYTAAFYMGLISSVSYSSAPVAGDTIASHSGWTEAGATNAPNYSAGTRPAATWASASGKSKALASSISFTFSASGTIKGSFLATNSTKDGTTGLLFSAGLFTGGDKVVASGDVLQVSYSLSV